MSTSRRSDTSSAAQVIDFVAASQRPAGQRSVERLRDGRRKGNHGNRASAAMRIAVIAQLKELLELRGHVTPEDKRACAAAAGVDPHTVNRWWATHTRAELERHRAASHPNDPDADTGGGTGAGACVEACVGNTHGRGCRTGLDVTELPGWLYKFNEPTRLQLTSDEIAFFATHTNTIEAIEAVRSDPHSRLRHYAPSTLYAAWANVSEPIRVGAKHNAKKQRAVEATYPLSGKDAVNETWSIDEYDLKLTARYRGIVVEPKVLIVRERLSGTPLAKLVLPRAANGLDTGKVLSAAAIGYTVPHPFDDDRDLRVSGVARYLTSDQGGPFLGEDGVAAARRLGIGLAPIASHEPQANGDHEVMHQSLLAYFVDGPGSRRGWADRADTRLDHGVLPYESVAAAVDDWFDIYLDTPYAKGARKGSTRLGLYAQAVDDGNIYTGHTLTPEDEAAYATVVAERFYDATRGVEWNNQHWLSRDLANKAVNQQKLVLRQLLNPDLLYVFDEHGKFLAIAEPREDGDVVDQHGLYRDRARRQQFIKKAAETRAAHARADADAIWNEVADGLADAAEAADDETVRAINEAAAVAAQGEPTPLADGTRNPVTDTEAREVVRPTSRRRKAPAQPAPDPDILEAHAEALARRLEAARDHQPDDRDQGGPHDGPQGGSEVHGDGGTDAP